MNTGHSAGVSYLGRPYFELGSAYEKYGARVNVLWVQPNTVHEKFLGEFRLWIDFGTAVDSDADLFMYRTKWISCYQVFCWQFDRNEYFSPLEFSTAGIKIGVGVNSAGLNKWSAFIRIRFGSLGTEKVGVWSGPKFYWLSMLNEVIEHIRTHSIRFSFRTSFPLLRL